MVTPHLGGGRRLSVGPQPGPSSSSSFLVSLRLRPTGGWEEDEDEDEDAPFQKSQHPRDFYHTATRLRRTRETGIYSRKCEPGHLIVRKDPQRVAEIAVDDPAVVMRLNLPEDYQRWVTWFEKQGSDA